MTKETTIILFTLFVGSTALALMMGKSSGASELSEPVPLDSALPKSRPGPKSRRCAGEMQGLTGNHPTAEQYFLIETSYSRYSSIKIFERLSDEFGMTSLEVARLFTAHGKLFEAAQRSTLAKTVLSKKTNLDAALRALADAPFSVNALAIKRESKKAFRALMSGATGIEFSGELLYTMATERYGGWPEALRANGVKITLRTDFWNQIDYAKVLSYLKSIGINIYSAEAVRYGRGGVADQVLEDRFQIKSGTKGLVQAAEDRQPDWPKFISSLGFFYVDPQIFELMLRRNRLSDFGITLLEADFPLSAYRLRHKFDDRVIPLLKKAGLMATPAGFISAVYRDFGSWNDYRNSIVWKWLMGDIMELIHDGVGLIPVKKGAGPDDNGSMVSGAKALSLFVPEPIPVPLALQMEGATEGFGQKSSVSSAGADGGASTKNIPENIPEFGSDEEYVTWFLAKYEKYLRGLTVRQARNAEDAKDLFQIVMMKVLNQRPTKDETLGWLRKVVQTTYIDQFIRGSYSRTNKESLLDEVLLDQKSALDAWHPDAASFMPSDNLVFQGELGKAISAARQNLPDIAKSTFELVAIQGMSYNDAAAFLNIPVGTVRSRLSRAKDFLKIRLQDFSNSQVSDAAN